MIIGIHQPHYLPWLGYMDKMAKSEKFIILDEVQLTDRSPMVRNKFLQIEGIEKTLSVSIEKHGYREKRLREIKLANTKDVQTKHKKFMECNYSKTFGYSEVMNEIGALWEKDYTYLFDLEMDSVLAIKRMLDIKTELVYQSEVDYDKTKKKGDLMLELTIAEGGNIYFSGNGARNYMEDETFEKRGVQVKYQKFNYPEYPQYKQDVFIPNLSSLDILFQCGIRRAREIFWNNVNSSDDLK